MQGDAEGGGRIEKEEEELGRRRGEGGRGGKGGGRGNNQLTELSNIIDKYQFTSQKKKKINDSLATQ